MKFIQILIVSIILSAGSVYLYAQAKTSKDINQYVRQSWLTENGLPQNSITSITQTPEGYLWFGSSEGLIRFDGVNFSLFTDKNSKGLVSNDIWALKTDSKGRMWIGCNTGGVVCYQDGVFKNFSAESLLIQNPIWCFYEDTKGNIWIGTGGGGIFVYDGKGFNLIDTAKGLSNNYIWVITEDKDGGIWAGTDGGFLNRIYKGKVKVYDSSGGYPGDYTMAGTRASDGSLWFGAAGYGIANFKDGKFKIYSSGEGLQNDIVWNIFEDKDKNLWVGTDDGIAKLSNAEFSVFREKDGLPASSVSCIFQDQEGNIWASTKGGGITKFRNGVLTNFSTYQGISHNNVYSVFSDSKNNTWFCTSKGLSVLSPYGMIKNYSAREGLSAEITLSIAEGKNGIYWIGTDGGGLYKLKNDRFTHIPLPGIADNCAIWSVYEDKTGWLWVSVDGYGIIKMNGTDYVPVTIFEGGLSGEFVSCFFEDHEGNIWAGTRDGSGLNKIYPDSVTVYTDKEGLLSNDIWSVYEDKQHNLWVATSRGLNKIKDGRIYSYDEKQGLPAKNLYSITDDNFGYLWIGTNSGLLRINKNEIREIDSKKRKTLNVLLLETSDGMKSSQCNNGFPSCTKTRSGEIWFPTIKGAVRVDPENIRLNSKVPAVLIEKVKINNSFVPVVSGSVVKPGKGDVEFYFTALSFAAIEKVRFKYKLEGWDKDWIDGGSRRSAFYTNLPPGEYVFRVIASNDAGVWNKKGASYTFELKPYFYQAKWFYALLIISAGFVVYFIIKFRVRQIKRNEKLLSQKVQERTEELKNTNLMLQTEVYERLNAENSLKQYNLRLESFDAIYRGIISAKTVDEIVTETITHLDKLFPEIEMACVKLKSTAPGEELFFNKEFHNTIEEPVTKKITAAKAETPFNCICPGKLNFKREGSCLSVPFIMDGDRIGMLSIAASNPKSFDKEQEDNLAIVGNQLSVAIIQAQLQDRIKQHAATLQDSLSEKEVMLKEIHHRVKNNLQVISSLLYLNSRKIKDKETLDIFNESQNRIKSIALVHERLYQSKDLARIDFNEYVHRLTNDLVRTYAVSHLPVSLEIDVDNIFISVDTAVPLGLIINELVSNSFKYAFSGLKDGEQGKIKISLKNNGNNETLLEVCDNGIGLPQELNKKKETSLGLKLVENLVSQIDGELEIKSGPGTCFRACFHLKD